MNHYGPSQLAAAQYDPNAKGLIKRDPKALEQIGGHLVMLRDRISMTISRVESISNRAFGCLEEISAAPAQGSPAPEPPGSIPVIQKLLAELDAAVSVLNKSIDKLETLA